ncbi:hypothetical protein FS837_008271 [Tulasnella sp. UAMH 9824]|nr:hypothetical protein FS837_008271 [Tulasnella sp. UAMH 9824]
MEDTLSIYPDRPHVLESNLWRTIAEPSESPLLNRTLTEYNELIPTWINPDGTSIYADMGYGPDADNGIFMTGNITEFRNDPQFTSTETTVEIRLYLVTLFNCGPSDTPAQHGDDLPCPEHENVAELQDRMAEKPPIIGLGVPEQLSATLEIGREEKLVGGLEAELQPKQERAIERRLKDHALAHF